MPDFPTSTPSRLHTAYDQRAERDRDDSKLERRVRNFKRDPEMERLLRLADSDPDFQISPAMRISAGMYRRDKDAAREWQLDVVTRAVSAYYGARGEHWRRADLARGFRPDEHREALRAIEEAQPGFLEDLPLPLEALAATNGGK